MTELHYSLQIVNSSIKFKMNHFLYTICNYIYDDFVAARCLSQVKSLNNREQRHLGGQEPLTVPLIISSSLQLLPRLNHLDLRNNLQVGFLIILFKSGSLYLT